MSEPVEEALANLINEFSQTISGLSDMGSEQIPDVLNQILLWEFWTSFTAFSAGIGLFLIILVTSVWYWRRNARKEPHDRLKYPFCLRPHETIIDFGFPILLMGASLILALSHMDWVKILIAPKAYLLDYALNIFELSKRGPN